MKFILASLIWLVMAAVIGAGIIWAVHGNPWLLILSLAGFVVAVGKIGCATH